MSQPPQDPFNTPLGTSANTLHEMYRAYRAAGFNEEQALRLLALLSAYTAWVQMYGTQQ